MLPPNSFSELFSKFINNETSQIINSKPQKFAPTPSKETGMFPNQVDPLYASELGFFKMAAAKQTSFEENKYYFKLLQTMFSKYLPNTAVHEHGTYADGFGFIQVTWVFALKAGKLNVTITHDGVNGSTQTIDTNKYL